MMNVHQSRDLFWLSSNKCDSTYKYCGPLVGAGVSECDSYSKNISPPLELTYVSHSQVYIPLTCGGMARYLCSTFTIWNCHYVVNVQTYLRLQNVLGKY
jgi:hypothetical protein